MRVDAGHEALLCRDVGEGARLRCVTRGQRSRIGNRERWVVGASGAGGLTVLVGVRTRGSIAGRRGAATGREPVPPVTRRLASLSPATRGSTTDMGGAALPRAFLA